MNAPDRYERFVVPEGTKKWVYTAVHFPKIYPYAVSVDLYVLFFKRRQAFMFYGIIQYIYIMSLLGNGCLC
jgi:hypothetical protein